MRVLITNNTLAARAGSELFVRDLALALQRRGHTPLAYSTDLGDVARELTTATVPVVDDLQALGAAPDIIHGHHHLDTMTALLHFDRAPAIYFCHGWIPWEEAPPPCSPRILRYIAVDEVCRDRLVFQHGIPEARVQVLLNFVDLARFPPRPPLPEKPARALIFSNYFSDADASPIREACGRLGITLDVIGAGSGNSCAAPESRLGAYDLVFAKGRAALEALATGSAVIVCDKAGLGGMVTAENLAEQRRLNFGIRLLRDRIDVESITREILRFSAPDAAQASSRIREEAGLDRALDRLISIYREVIGEAAAQASFDRGEEARAASRYLRWLSPILKGRYHAEARAAQAAQRLEALQAEDRRRSEDRLEVDSRLAAQAGLIEILTGRAADRDVLEARVAVLGQEIAKGAAGRESLQARIADLADSATRLAQAIQRERERELLLEGITEERDARQRQLDQIAASRAWRWIRRYGQFREHWRSFWRA
jgi:hypothetical protein